MDGLEQSQLTGTSYLVQSVRAGPYRPHSSGVKLLSLFYSVPVERLPRADQWKYRLCCSGTREIIQPVHGCMVVKSRCQALELAVPQDSCSPWKTLVSSQHGRLAACPGMDGGMPDRCSESRQPHISDYFVPAYKARLDCPSLFLCRMLDCLNVLIAESVPGKLCPSSGTQVL